MPRKTNSSNSPNKTKVTKKKVKEYPTYDLMISSAILNLKERDGSSYPAITKYILQHYKVPPETLKTHLPYALKKGVATGKFEKIKASYKISKSAKPNLKKALISRGEYIKQQRKPSIKKEDKLEKKVNEKSEEKELIKEEEEATRGRTKLPKSKKTTTSSKSPKKIASKSPKKSSSTPKKTISKSPKKLKSPKKSSISKSPKKSSISDSPKKTISKNPKKVKSSEKKKRPKSLNKSPKKIKSSPKKKEE